VAVGANCVLAIYLFIYATAIQYQADVAVHIADVLY
jgi:hypothetical protein